MINTDAFTPISALAGGVLIGAAATLFLLTHGRVAGISGILGGIFRRDASDRDLRLAFIAGLTAAGVVLRMVWPSAWAVSFQPSLGFALAAGVLVGVGTQLGSGCTSGHGVCGLSRFSVRSLVATLTFMATGMSAVYIIRRIAEGVGQ